MTVCNRSNDIVFGAYGANVVHMSYLHEYMASMINVQMGVYNQISDSFHAYKDVLDNIGRPINRSLYELDGPRVVEPYPLMMDKVSFDQELKYFLDGRNRRSWDNLIFRDVAQPMQRAWEAHKMSEYKKALGHCAAIEASDWRAACIEWITRREVTWRKKQGEYHVQ